MRSKEVNMFDRIRDARNGLNFLYDNYRRLSAEGASSFEIRQAYNDYIQRLEYLNSLEISVGQYPTEQRFDDPYENTRPSTTGALRSRKPTRVKRMSSPVRGRGMTCSQPRDPRTGKFVSRYY